MMNKIINNAIVKTRIGHANNSSSSHSIVFGIHSERNSYTTEYGWDSFVLSSKESKNQYMIAQLLDNINAEISISGGEYFDMPDLYDMTKDMKLTLIQSIMKSYGIECTKSSIENTYIDHQSTILLPLNTKGKINIEFWRDLRDYVVNSDVSIMGGNDNNESNPSDNYTKVFLPLEKDRRRNWTEIYAIKDNKNNRWIIKNKTSGSVTILDFYKKDDKEVKSEVPLLVDLNITNKCTHGCPQCYRNCTPTGKDALRKNIENILEVLNEHNAAIDLVIGGGDISKFDDLSVIFDSIPRMRSITTTISQKTIIDTNNWRSYYYISRFDSIAITLSDYSPEGKAEFIKLAVLLKEQKVKDIVCQVIFETFDDLFTLLQDEDIRKCVNSFSLIGYKNTGRAPELDVSDKSYVTKVLKLEEFCEKNYRRIYFDAIMIERYGQVIKTLDIYKVGRDGINSCYIDAVGNTMSKNSYCKENELHKFNDFDKEFLEIWEKL
jgi:MoaA/NifB/PqqE/SkfB family radical SAM enzyme